MSGSAGIIASIAKALSAISPASSAMISRAPGRGPEPRQVLQIERHHGGCWRSSSRHARGRRTKWTQSATKTRVRLIGLPTDSPFVVPSRGGRALPPRSGRPWPPSTATRQLKLAVSSASTSPSRIWATCRSQKMQAISTSIGDAAEAAARDGTVPIFLGGDHMVTFPIVERPRRGPRPGEHPPFRRPSRPVRRFRRRSALSHASPFARIMERGLPAAWSRSASGRSTAIAAIRQSASASR